MTVAYITNRITSPSLTGIISMYEMALNKSLEEILANLEIIIIFQKKYK